MGKLINSPRLELKRLFEFNIIIYNSYVLTMPPPGTIQGPAGREAVIVLEYPFQDPWLRGAALPGGG
jgi:hypothetical protein